MLHIEDCVAEDNQGALVSGAEGSGEGIVLGLYDYSVPQPLPELTLCGPKFGAIRADHPRCSFFTFSSFLFGQLIFLHAVPSFFARHNLASTSFDLESAKGEIPNITWEAIGTWRCSRCKRSNR